MALFCAVIRRDSIPLLKFLFLSLVLVLYYYLHYYKYLLLGPFLSILADLNYAVVWMVITCPLISKSSSLFTHHLRIVPSSPTSISIMVTFMFRRFFCFLARSWYSFLLSLFFIHLLKAAETTKSTVR